MRETGNEWGGLGDLLDPNFLSPGQGDRYTSVTEASQNFNEPDVVVPNHPQDESSGESNEDRPPEQGRISRISSPPNVSSLSFSILYPTWDVMRGDNSCKSFKIVQRLMRECSECSLPESLR
jgi:hypothetical protein